MKIVNWLIDVFLHLIRRIIQIIFPIILQIICLIIYIVTFEPNTKHKPTKRKAKRIRFLTKTKLYIYRWFKPIFLFAHSEYFPKLYERFHYLIDKKK